MNVRTFDEEEVTELLEVGEDGRTRQRRAEQGNRLLGEYIKPVNKTMTHERRETPRAEVALSITNLMQLTQTCHIFEMAIRIFDLK